MSCKPWTPAQSLAIREFIQRADSATPNKPSTINELTHRIMTELGPGAIGARTKDAIRHRICRVRGGNDEEEYSGSTRTFGPVWSSAQKLALRGFVQQEEAAAAAGKYPSIKDLARSAMAQLVPGVLGPRSKGAVWSQIQIIRAQAKITL
jgi:hypothetical protein